MALACDTTQIDTKFTDFRKKIKSTAPANEILFNFFFYAWLMRTNPNSFCFFLWLEIVGFFTAKTMGFFLMSKPILNSRSHDAFDPRWSTEWDWRKNCLVCVSLGWRQLSCYSNENPFSREKIYGRHTTVVVEITRSIVFTVYVCFPFSLLALEFEHRPKTNTHTLTQNSCRNG